MGNDVTYGWCRVAWALTRCLAQNGVKVFVGGPEERTMSSVSRYCHGNFVYPSPYTDPHGFCRAVVQAAERFSAQVFIPVHEEILVVAKYRHLFPEWLAIPITTHENLLTAYDKGKCMALAARLGVNIPKTFYPEGPGDLDQVLEEAQFPVIIKLRHSNSAKGVLRVDEPDRLSSTLGDFNNQFQVRHPPIIQEFIEGTIYTANFLYDNGKEVSHFTRRNIREKSRSGGAATKVVSVEAPLLLEESRKILDQLKWHGVALCEFKYDPDRKKSWLFEINPRYWGTISHDIDCGVAFPYDHYLIATGSQQFSSNNCAVGKSSRWLVGDGIGFLDHWNGWNGALHHMKTYLTFDDDFYMDFKVDDPLPFIVQSWFYMKKFIKTGSRNPIDEDMVG